MSLRRALLIPFALALTYSPALAYDLTYQNMLTASMRLNPAFDYDNTVDAYMQAFCPAVWQKYHDDEFERHTKEAETLDIMKKASSSFNLNDPIVIHTGLQFGEYDFKQHAFAMHPFSDSVFFPVNYCCVQGLPNQIKLFFSNPDLLDGLPMDDQTAKAFLDRHKQYGNVNRQLNAEISVVLTSAKTDYELIGKITKIVVSDPMNKNAPIQTFTASNGS